jgi:hypothetical protein
MSNVFCSPKGRMYDSWIDEPGRYTNGGVYSSGSLIQNPAHVIESIYRDELGFASVNIDLDSFDKAAERRKNWDCAGVIYTRKFADEYISEIAEQFGIRLCWHFGKIAASVYDWWDGEHQNGSTIVKIFDDHNITQNSISLFKTDIDDLCNDFLIEYDFSYAHGKFLRQVYTTMTGSSLPDPESWTLEVQETDTKYYRAEGKKHTLRIGATFIRQTDTAKKLLAYSIKRYTRRRHMIGFQTYIEGLELNVFDVIKINHPTVPESLRTKQWEIQRLKHNWKDFTTKIQAICVEDEAE